MRRELGISPELQPIGLNNSPAPGVLNPLRSNPGPGVPRLPGNNSPAPGALNPLRSNPGPGVPRLPGNNNNPAFGAVSPLHHSSPLLTLGALNPLRSNPGPGVPSLPGNTNNPAFRAVSPLHHSSPLNGVPLLPARHLQEQAKAGTNLPGARMQH